MRLRKRWWRVTGGASFEPPSRHETRDVRARTETGAVKAARKQVGGYMLNRIDSICPHDPPCKDDHR